MTLSERIGRAGQGIAARWNDGDVERVWQGLRRKRRRRAAAAGAGLLSAVGLVLAAAFVLRSGGPLTERGWDVGWRPGAGVRTPTVGSRPMEEPRPNDEARPAAPTPMVAPSGERGLRLTDGSTVVPWGAGAQPGSLAVVEDGPRRVLIALGRGGARFDVVRRPERVFSVRAGEVTVTVLGTAFSVERVADRVGVVVTRGSVLVDWGVGSRRLVAGQEGGDEGWFPPLVVAPVRAGAHPAAASNDPRRVRRVDARAAGPGTVARKMPRIEAPRSQDDAPTPIAAPVGNASPEAPIGEDTSESARPVEAPPSAGRGESGREASRASRTESSPAAPSVAAREEANAGALLADADRARLAGRLEEGASLLRRLVRDFSGDPRAPLAAFSLGRLLLGELGRPDQAARAFARSRALAPEGPLAEDALAREAEAWAQAGDLDRARARAAEYARRYPSGRRAADVNDAIGRAGASSPP